ncbi:MAG TPA: Ig-like domain-containing protein [Burkholderiales bacterium]|nr:Ig-like domain-containing protein [Burkholderiales bacterium]
MTHKFFNLKNFIIKLILVFLILFELVDCSGGGSGHQNNKTISSITVTPASVNIPIGVITQFQATAIYSDNSKQDVTNLVAWSSSSPSIATVSNSTNSLGVVTPVATGTTLITANLGSVSGSANLTVNAATLQSAAISSISSIMVAGTNQQLTAIGIFSDGSKQDITLSVKWSANDNNLASISNTPGSVGVLSAINIGTIIVNISLPTNITNSLNSNAKFKNTLASLATLSIISSSSPIKSIQVSPSNYKMYVGTQQQYNAEAILEDGTQYDVTSSVVWSEPNNFINSQGYLTAKFATNTSITATLGALSGSTNLTVVSASLQSIAISPINPTVGIGIPLQFTATGTFSDGGSQDITAEATWFSSDTKIATINNPFTSSGITTPLTVGSTNITASLNGVTSFSTTLNVVPKTLDSIQISPTNTTIPLGVKQQFTATGIYSDGSTEDITYDAVWASSATNVATIGNAENNSGLATPLTNGSTNITASLDGVTSAISTLTISNATIQSVQISPTNPKIYLGSEQQFTATGIYSDGSTEDITNQATWTSSQTNIATISNFTGNEGLATPLALGSTNITATFNGKVSLASTLTVSNATLQSIQISPINPSTSINTPIQLQ